MALSMRSRSFVTPASGSSRSSGLPQRVALRASPVLLQRARGVRSLVVSASAAPSASTSYQPGTSIVIESEEMINELLKTHKDKLLVVMCKSTHCKPCKAFMPTYYELSERFCDFVFTDLTGDSAPELRVLMKSWQVKVTPTFRLYRGGEMIEITTGTGGDKLKNVLLTHVKAGERGIDWVAVTHEDMSEGDE